MNVQMNECIIYDIKERMHLIREWVGGYGQRFGNQWLGHNTMHLMMKDLTSRWSTILCSRTNVSIYTTLRSYLWQTQLQNTTKKNKECIPFHTSNLMEEAGLFGGLVKSHCIITSSLAGLICMHGNIARLQKLACFHKELSVHIRKEFSWSCFQIPLHIITTWKKLFLCCYKRNIIS